MRKAPGEYLKPVGTHDDNPFDNPFDKPSQMNERNLWLTIRRALLMIVRAIEKRFDLQKEEK